MTILFETIF